MIALKLTLVMKLWALSIDKN